jgi:hypothetical protein
MPNGYYIPYVADSDQRYWNVGFGRIDYGFATSKCLKAKDLLD